jgi:hypothetical protein
MTYDPAIDWLESAGMDYDWPNGPSCIRPMIELLGLIPSTEPMRVTTRDYDDPLRWWL